MTCYHLLSKHRKYFRRTSDPACATFRSDQRSLWCIIRLGRGHYCLSVPTIVDHESRSTHLLRHSPAARFKVLPKQYIFVFQLRSPVGNQSHHPDRPHHADPGPNEEYRSLAVNGRFKFISDERKNLGTDCSASFAHRSSEAKGVPSNRSRKRFGRYDKVVVTWANTQEALKKAKNYHETGESARTTGS